MVDASLSHLNQWIIDCVEKCQDVVFSYLMVAGAIDWNICPEVLGMTKGQMFQSIAPETTK
jgi:hypothetical protein